MDRFLFRGGRPLHGEISIGGAKNSALKLLVAGLLTSERVVLRNVPRIDDIATMRLLLEQHGLSVADVPEVDDDGHTVSVGGEIANSEAPYDCWHAVARHECRCRAAARSAPGRWTCT